MNSSKSSVSLQHKVKSLAIHKIADSPYRIQISDRLSTKNISEIVLGLIFLVNLTTFLAVALCSFGLGIVAACIYISIAYFFIAFSGCLQWYQYKSKPNRKDITLITELVEDSSIAAALFANSISQQTSDPIITLSLVVAALFIQSAISVKPFKGFCLSKVLLFFSSLTYVVFYNDSSLNIASIIFPLTVSFVLLFSVGYWLYIRQVRTFHMTFSQNHLNEMLIETSQELANANQLREKIIRHIGHDLRQPINSLNYAIFNIRSSALDAEQKQQLELASRSIESTNYLIEEILQISSYKKEGAISINIEMIELWDILEDLYKQYLSVAQQSSCRLRLAKCSLVIQNDSQIILRILRNFLSNAIRYAKGSKILIGVRRRGDSVELQILDSGPGMTKALLESACEEFTQGKQSAQEDGFGLGLNIAKNLAGAINGQISIKSVLKRGTLCSLTIPIEVTIAKDV